MPSTRKRQTRLAFSPLPSSSPASSSYHPQIRDRAAAITLDHFASPRKRRRLENGNTNAIVTPDASLEVDADSDSEPVRKVRRRNTPSSSCLPVVGVVGPPTAARGPTSSGMFTSQPDSHGHNDFVDNESDISTDLPSPRPETTSRNKRSKRRQDKSKGRGSEAFLTMHSNIDDEQDVVPIKTNRERRTRRPVSLSSLESWSTPGIGEDEVTLVGRTSKQSQDSTSEDEPVTPKVRRLLKRPRQMSQREREEKDDLAEDLDFLEPESDAGTKTPISSRSTKKSARQAALEQLKLRRSGAVEPDAAREKTGEESDGSVEDGELDVWLGDDEVAEDDDDLQVISSRQIFQSTQEDEDFIVDADENETLGEMENVPLAFTSFASEKPKNLFKFAVEWFVQKKINPAFAINDEIYDLTFKKLDDEIRGLAGSKFTSSAWTPDFTTALQARPEIMVDDSPSGLALRDKCDACNRSGHPATFLIRFLNKPYDKETLEEVTSRNDGDSDDEDSNSDSDSDSQSPNHKRAVDRDYKGRIVPSESTEFYVGKFCTANAKTAHALSHWKYHLNEWVVIWLTSQGYCSAEALLERDKMSTRKRRKRANKIVDRMVDEGVLKTLWREFRSTADTARNSKQGRYDFASP